MDVVRNFQSMSAKQFMGVQLFELVYLLTLAFLPFVLAIPVVTYVVLTLASTVLFIAFLRKCLYRRVRAEGKVVFITGCDSGLGNACAHRLDSLGFTVVAACYDEKSDGARRLREDCSSRLYVETLDIANENSVMKCVSKVKSLCGSKGLWALINNAGTVKFGDVELTPLESYREVMDVNILGTIQVTQACLPLIRTSKGRIITLTGIQGLMATPGFSAFSISKFGLEAFNESLRFEMKQFKVKVITVRPGNFSGATAMLNKAGLEKIKKSLDEVKTKASLEVRTAYGDSYTDQQYTQLTHLSKSSANNCSNVIDTLESAVSSTNPSPSYLVDGGNQLLDLGNVLIRLRPYLPTNLYEGLIQKYFGC
ncbi:retinol dehydrogenase 7 [Biomphalaria glabrata]|uniref:Retinol dehydrogenase 7-like n=1 Tax=Biomphalaria glabrata TaxID=6526 RepID=A0A9U8DWE1_BIOGL|nr:retinol dehydrogenase 7-like [Biomphalaria glabrata]XP_013063266.2 retinol dehydrogenase 7-like [Biomphalaria glabrata]KAI8765604.1 retinol dehydrogenase 7-like [Biomphalaria glabrata]